jgi:transcriptional regulator with XRE-family HTH domain
LRKSNVPRSPRSCDPIDVLVGRNIRIHRLDKALTQTDVASRIGVTFQQLQKYEQGMNRVGGARLFKVAEVLEVPISALFESGPDTPEIDSNSAMELLGEAYALRLLRPFSRIADVETRRALVAVVEALAASEQSD